jgi:hypothetical protein
MRMKVTKPATKFMKFIEDNILSFNMFLIVTIIYCLIIFVDAIGNYTKNFSLFSAIICPSKRCIIRWALSA